MINEHAKIAPSAMARTMQCAYSRELCERFPQDPADPKTAEGIAAHWVLEQAHAGVTVDEGALAPNGVEVTSEMLDGAELFRDSLPRGITGIPHIEERVDCSSIHPDCWGTPDWWAFDEREGFLYVYDYKFGHRFVDSYENWQLLTYLIGILARLGAQANVLRIELVVVQPRSFHRTGPVKSWTLKVRDVAPYAARISTAAYASMQAQPRATTGPACLDCSGRHACTTLQEHAMRGVELSQLGLPVEVSPAAAGRELRTIWHAMEALKARATGLEAQVENAIRCGTPVSGLGLDSGAGKTVWKVPPGEVKSLGQAIGIPLEKPSVLTPRQAIQKGAPKEVIDAFTEHRSGTLKLVETSDSNIRKLFQQAQEN